ncbi:hypothetical protein BTVI_25187 [Pitangus sulphuratus]|nr:hypothetical protein BTVI_25187 [Pitangus sulphuratus]
MHEGRQTRMMDHVVQWFFSVERERNAEIQSLVLNKQNNSNKHDQKKTNKEERNQTKTSTQSSDGSLSEVVQKWKEYQLQCQKYLYETPPIVAEGKFCNRTFDDYACWPDGLPGTYVNVSCPWYLPWANAAQKANRVLGCTKRNLPSRSKQVILPFYSALGKIPPGELHTALVPPTSEEHGTVGASPEECHDFDERTEAPALLREAEKVLAIQPGEEKDYGPRGLSALSWRTMTVKMINSQSTLKFCRICFSREIPADWNLANVVSIFEKGKKEDLANYRPVSLTLVPGIVKEKIILKTIEKYPKDNTVIGHSQHSFMRGKSYLSKPIFVHDKAGSPPVNPVARSVLAVLHGQVYRFCTLEGTWLLKENSTLPWRNLSECESSDQDAPEEQLLNLSIIYTIGYALSFSALVIATAILLGFRHLHCTRNYIHLNLFTSFILRAISVFIKDSVVKWMYSTATQEHQWEGLIAFQESLSCRLVFVMMQYCVAANYYWLLVEGMYLYTLLVLSVFSEQRIFRLYLCIGWDKLTNCGTCTVRGVPMLFVILWGTVKYLYEDEGCWTRNYNMNYWLIIRLPILIAIGVNFLIFIRVICIIISKLQANLMCKTDIKCRLAKSTLTLIPLLGTHEVIFAFITDEHARGMLRFVKLFTELSFASFQGLMVAILYCFINNEVQMEFRKSWERWRLEHLYVQRDSSMKPLKCPANSISSGGTVGSSVYAATCQATFS